MNTFLKSDRPLITPLLASTEESSLLKEISDSLAQGADAFGLQIERLPKGLRSEKKMKNFFAAMQGKPIYVTCYPRGDVIEETDEERAETLINALKWGATLADVRGDLFCHCDGEMTYDRDAVEKQKELIRRIHNMGKEALISSHIIYNGVFRFLTKEEVLSIALEQQSRGADIAKIVTKADTEEELLENFEAITLLKRKVGIPVLFLCNGEKCLRHRLGGGLIYEPIVFVKEKSHCPESSSQPPIEQMATLFRNAGMM